MDAILPRKMKPLLLKRLTTLLSLALLVQCISLLRISFSNGSISSYFFMNWRLPDALSMEIDSGGALLVSSIAFYFLFLSAQKKERQLQKFEYGLGIFSALWFFFVATASFINGGHFGSSFALFSNAARFSLPLVVITLLWKRHAGQTQPQNLAAIFQLATWAISITFFTHGIEALLLNPIFVDYVVLGWNSILGTRISETTSALLLRGVGIIDILCAIALIVRPLRKVALWMAFWGIFTASLRLLGFGFQNWGEFGIRFSHFALPLALYYYWRDVHGETGSELKTFHSIPFFKRKT